MEEIIDQDNIRVFTYLYAISSVVYIPEHRKSYLVKQNKNAGIYECDSCILKDRCVTKSSSKLCKYMLLHEIFHFRPLNEEMSLFKSATELRILKLLVELYGKDSKCR